MLGCFLGCILGSKFFTQSQLFVVQLRGLQQTANLLPSLHVCRLGITLLLLLFDNE